MDILNNLNSCFKIDVKEAAATTEEIELLLAFSSINVPNEYLDIVGLMTEVEILINNNKYFRIWNPSGCIEMNEAYQVQTYIPNSLAIGDDEDGSALILMTGTNGFGLYKVGFGDLDIDAAEYVSPSLDDFLTKGVGAEVI